MMQPKAASVVVYDQSDGLFSELLDATTVVAALSSSSSLSTGQSALRSVRYGYPDNRTPSADIPIKFSNYTSSFLRIRWVDTDGNIPPSHGWTLAPNEDWDQRTLAGHIFVVSVIVQSSTDGENDLFGSNESEEIIGAFRPKRTLPSGSYHSVQVHDGDNSINEDSNKTSFILEVVLSEGESSYDALVVASYWLDHEIISKQSRQDSVKTLQKIISNIIKDPNNVKYRKLRLSNAAISKYVGKHWSVMEFLHVLGFEKKNIAINKDGTETEKEDYLFAESVPNDTKLSLYRKGATLLELLQSRCQHGFVADLAPPTPWDEPVLLNGSVPSSGGGGRWGTAGSTHFISPDDRWERVDRARRFRGRAGPRPTPGNAPSDRGRWGR